MNNSLVCDKLLMSQANCDLSLSRHVNCVHWSRLKGVAEVGDREKLYVGGLFQASNCTYCPPFFVVRHRKLLHTCISKYPCY